MVRYIFLRYPTKNPHHERCLYLFLGVPVPFVLSDSVGIVSKDAEKYS